MKPIVKWAGGKTRLLGALLSRVPTNVDTYVEPFAGGAALFFALASEAAAGRRTYARAVLVDQNPELVACYRAVRDDVEGVIEALRHYHYDEAMFYAERERDTSKMGDVERAARLIFLNRTCFNGLWRVNAAGRFNVPFGRHKNPRIVDEDRLRAAQVALARAEILHGDFANATQSLKAGEFVYFDPPYAPLSKTTPFTSYAAGGFGPSDQHRLAAEFERLKACGVRGMLSNADTKGMRAMYKDWPVHIVSAPRPINSDPSKRGNTREILVTSWGVAGVHRERATAKTAGAKSAGAKAAPKQS